MSDTVETEAPPAGIPWIQPEIQQNISPSLCLKWKT
jgi:hypothetical protein